MNFSGNWSKAVDKYSHPGQGKLKLFLVLIILISCMCRHTVCSDGKTIYLFGGADLEQRTSELYTFDPSNQTFLWLKTHQ
jgi:hypothetical protein